jgi:hypothetical protein
MAYVCCRPGEGITKPRPGDLVLIRGRSWASKIILFGERVRFRTPQDRPFAHWSHVAAAIPARKAWSRT